MATKAAHKRLTREYQNIQKSPIPYITAHPSESNILEWHYILTGPPDTPYHNGQYWGTLTFPPDYPFAPPAIRMHTPSGRFKCSERLCLSTRVEAEWGEVHGPKVLGLSGASGKKGLGATNHGHFVTFPGINLAQTASVAIRT